MENKNLNYLRCGIKFHISDGRNILLCRPYDTITKENGVFIGCAEIVSDYGCFAFRDKISINKDTYKVEVNLTVKSLSSLIDGIGIHSGVVIPEDYDDLQFFMPSAWYGDKEFFIDKSNKYPYIDGIAGGGVDGIGLPVCAVFSKQNNKTYSIEAVNPEYSACIPNEEDLVIDEQNTIPAIGYENKEESLLFYEFPATYYHLIGSNRTIYYYIPATEDQEIQGSYEFESYSSRDFSDCLKTVWRKAYDKYAVVNEHIDCNIARNVLLEYVANSYGVVNGIPQYFTDADHFTQESGFLFRNADLAYLMLIYGYAILNNKIVEEAINVIEVQVKEKLAGENQVFPFERSRAEGVWAVLKAYNFLITKGIEKTEWYTFVREETERFARVDEYYSIPLLCDMNLVDAAIRKAENIWLRFSNMNFFGGIVDFIADPVLDRESGYVGLNAYLSIYEKTKDKKWLERAKFCGDYLETYQVLRLHGYKLEGISGNEHYNMAAVGNESFFCNGLSYISANCNGTDVFNVYAVPQYYKLWLYLSDEHYLDYARLLEKNSLEYIDLNNKAGSLSDVMYGTGAGFMNEYYQLAVSHDHVGPFTGTAHDANIGWMAYGILSAQNEILRITGKPYIDGNSIASMYQNIASLCHFSNEDKKKTLTSRNFYHRTYFNASESIVIELDIPVSKIVLAHVEKYVSYEYIIECYCGKELIHSQMHNGAARFTSFEIDEKCSDIKITFLNDVILRQIQIFGEYKSSYVLDAYDQPIVENVYCNGSGYSSKVQCLKQWSYMSRKGEKRSPLVYDNIKNAWRSDDEYLCVKSGNLVHPGNQISVVEVFTVDRTGNYEIERFISPAQYLNVFGSEVIASIYLDEQLLVKNIVKLEITTLHKQCITLPLTNGQKIYFEIKGQNGNCNTFVCDDIQIKQKGAIR
jgi:hypothetical protein